MSDFKNGDYITIDTLRHDGCCGHSFGYFIKQEDSIITIRSENTGDILTFNPKDYQKMTTSKGWFS